MLPASKLEAIVTSSHSYEVGCPMGDPVVDALSITITTLQEKISSLEEEVNAMCVRLE